MKRATKAAIAIIVLLLSSALYLVAYRPGGSTATTSVASTTSSQGWTASSSGQSTASPGANWTTYQADDARTGDAPTANFTAVAQDWRSPSLDGPVYAQPLVYGGEVFVATENDSVYALDAATGAVVWRTHLGSPVPGGDLQCGDSDPSGITGTPVIDPSTGVLYVVAFSALQHTLYGIETASGTVVFHQPADPPGFVATAQQQRSALSLANGMVYIPYGGLAGDCGQYHGWVVALDANGSAGMAVYQVPTTREGGIWAPSGAAIDPAGDVFVATGNGASLTAFDYGDSVLRLGPSLSLQGYFAPTDWVQLNQDDGDLGSTGPAIVGPGLIFQVGKAGVGYLLNASELGGIGGQLYAGSVCSGSYGGTAFSSPLLFVPCRDGLAELDVQGSSFSSVWKTSGFDAGPPVVTGGIVWTVDISTATLEGFSVATGHEVFAFSLGSVVNFCPLSAGDGRLFVASGGGVEAWMLG